MANFEHCESNSPTTDALRKILDLACETSKKLGVEDDPQATKDSRRTAKIAMQVAINALETSENQQDPVESIITQRLAEEKEKRRAEKVRERARMEQELRERDKYWEQEIERVRCSVEQRMIEERELECEWQEAKYEAKRRCDEANQRSIEQAANDVVKRAQEKVAKFQEEAEKALREVLEMKAELIRAQERADYAKKLQEKGAAQDEADRQQLQKQQEMVAWSRYESQWQLLKRVSTIIIGGDGVFCFEDLPWPTVIPPTSPSAITSAEVAGFLFSGPALEEGVTLKSRVKDCLLRWHPDKFSGRWMQCIIESDRARVSEGIDAVTRAGNEVMAEYSNHRARLPNA